MTLEALLIFIIAGTIVVAAMIARRIWAVVRIGRERHHLTKEMLTRIATAAAAEGGQPDHPIEIDTPALVEPMSKNRRCLNCDHPMRLEAHRAEDHEDTRLRVAELRCPHCDATRKLYFKLRPVN